MVHEVKEKNLFQQLKQSVKEIGYKTASLYVFTALFLVAIAVTFVATQHQQDLRQHASGPTSYLETFDGSPTSPQPFTQLMQNTIDVAVQSRDTDTWDKLVPMQAMHSPDCGAPMDANGNLVTHLMDGNYDNAVFKCKDHLMTSIAGNGNTMHDGYAAIYLTPNAMADFSNGEATIRFDMSTLRTSARDWVDIWVTPYSENLQLPFDEGEVDLQGNPKDAVTIKMGSPNDGNKSGFEPIVFNNFKETNDFPSFSDSYNWYTGIEDIMKTSPIKRSTFELKISKTHIKFCMPAGQVDINGNPVNGGKEFCWADKNIAPLPFSVGVVQFAQHSYTPDKDCSFSPALLCKPDTWHWDNLSISPSIPFNMIKADRRFTDSSATPVVFNAPAPSAAYLRFSAVGKVQISYNNGSTWTSVSPQPSSDQTHPEHFGSYFTPIAEGTSKVLFKFASNNGYDGPFRAKDFAIWSLTPGSIVTTIVPTNIPNPTAVAATPTSTPKLTVTPTPAAGQSTLSLSPSTLTAVTGQTFTTKVIVNTNGNTANGVETDITYPANLLSVSNISSTNGDFDIEAQKTYSNGTIRLAYGATVPQSGNLLVATITFKALTSGDAKVSFTNSSVVSSATNTNILKSSTGGLYTIVKPSPTPTPTLKPTAIPTATPTPKPTATPTPTSKIGDINNDNKVDAQDLSYLLSHWGTQDALADLNHDKKVNTFDLSILLSHWGK